MSKWKKLFDAGVKPDPDAFKDKWYRVRMRGWAFWLFLIHKNIKIIDNGFGINRWVWKWGNFYIQYGRKDAILSYNLAENSWLVSTICDYVRASDGMLVGDFNCFIKGKYRHIAWFTLEEVGE